MRTVQIIHCPQCGEPCGRQYPDRILVLDGGELGFAEGKGEDFQVNGVWHCSQACADKTVADLTPPEHE
jgi:hypothetical protein